MTKINSSNLQYAIDLYNSGKTFDEISDIIGCSKSNVRYYMHKNNVHIRESGRRSAFTEDQKQQIIKMYVDDRIKMEDIGKFFGKTTTTIYRVLKENNIVARKPDETHRKYEINDSYFDVIDTPNKAYILGFLYSDGCNCSNYKRTHYRVSLALQSSDEDILVRINNEIGSTHPIQRIHRKSDGMYNRSDVSRLDIPNKKMALRLDELGVFPNKTYYITFPEWLNKELYPHFVRGVLDGDGHILKDLTRIGITGTIALCNSIKQIVYEKFGIMSFVKPYTDRCIGLADWYMYKNEDKIKFLDWIYNDADLKLDRKYNLYLQMKNKSVNINLEAQFRN